METNVYLFLGGPGCGKSSVCYYLKEIYGFEHISVGSLFRREIKTGSVLGKIIKNSIKKGIIVDSDISLSLLEKELEKFKGKSIMIDGYPRDMNNYNKWNDFLKNNPQYKENIIFYLDTKPENMFDRVLCRNNENDNRRLDDDEKIVKKRINTFFEESKIVVEIIEINKKDKLVKINGNNEKDRVLVDIIKVFRQNNIK